MLFKSKRMKIVTMIAFVIAFTASFAVAQNGVDSSKNSFDSSVAGYDDGVRRISFLEMTRTRQPADRRKDESIYFLSNSRRSASAV
jgi:hypothetical protein